MFDLKNLARAITQVAEEKGIDAAKVLDAVESSIAAAYKKEYEKRGEVIKSKFNIKTGDVKFWQVKIVVDETTADMTKLEEGETEAPMEMPRGRARGNEPSFAEATAGTAGGERKVASSG